MKKTSPSFKVDNKLHKIVDLICLNLLYVQITASQKMDDEKREAKKCFEKLKNPTNRLNNGKLNILNKFQTDAQPHTNTIYT